MQVMVNKCKQRTNPGKCIKYYRNLFEKGKDVKKTFKFQKLEREQKQNKNQNGELSKRLDLLEKKTESELRWMPHACKHTCIFQFSASLTLLACVHFVQNLSAPTHAHFLKFVNLR